MSYKIILDSSGELPAKLKVRGNFEKVSLEIFLDDY